MFKLPTRMFKLSRWMFKLSQQMFKLPERMFKLSQRMFELLQRMFALPNTNRLRIYKESLQRSEVEMHFRIAFFFNQPIQMKLLTPKKIKK